MSILPQCVSSCARRLGTDAGRRRLHVISKLISPCVSNLGGEQHHVNETNNGKGLRIEGGLVIGGPWNYTVSNFSTKAATTKVSYFERKKQAKEQRTKEFQEKLERLDKQLKRREGKPKDVLKSDFRPWWNKRMAYEQMMDRRARSAGMDWKIEVGVILERIPVVLPDKDDWETEFDELYAYLSQFGKEYPKEFTGETGGTSDEDFEPVFSDEDAIALLPENYIPAPRETEADLNGDVRTLDRRLKTRVFLTVQDGDNGSQWQLPTVPLKKDETLLDAAKRAIADQAGGERIDLYCPSNCPVAVHLTVSPEEERTDGYYGVKTFFMRVQYDEGDISKKDMKVKDYAWLDRDEIVERISTSQGVGQSKFYRYLL